MVYKNIKTFVQSLFKKTNIFIRKWGFIKMKKGVLKKIISAGTTAAMITACISASAIQAAGVPDSNGNYFTNSFESSTENWSGRGSASVNINNRNYYDGSNSLYVSGREAEWNGASIALDSSMFVIGETYSFSAAVLQTSGKDVTIQMSLQQSNEDGASYTHITDCTAKSGEWTKLENTEFTIPANSGDMVLYIETPEASGDLCSFYIDAIQVSTSGKPSSVVTGQGVVSNTSSSNDSIIKIMPIGDSITFGLGETGGYRKYLNYFLNQKGYSKVDMVGPEGTNSASFNYNGKSVSYDDNHAGYSGFTIKQQYPIPSWGENGLYERLKSKNAIKQAQPDIVLLIIGTNDMTANRPTSECEKDLHTLIDYILADLPSDSIIFMGSIPEFTAYGGNPQRIANYNSTVKKVADDYSSSGKNVKFADVHGCLNGAYDLTDDNLHPNGTGYEKMGKFWANVIDEYIIASQPVVTTTTTTTTTTTAPPQIIIGDTNSDGVFNVADVVMLSKWLISSESITDWESGDINADNFIDIFDLVMMKRLLLEQ